MVVAVDILVWQIRYEALHFLPLLVGREMVDATAGDGDSSDQFEVVDVPTESNGNHICLSALFLCPRRYYCAFTLSI